MGDGISIKGSTEAPDLQEQSSNRAGGNTGRSKKVPHIQAIMAGYARPSQLGEDGHNYVEYLTKGLEKLGRKVTSKFYNDNNVDCVLISDSSRGHVLLVFGETYVPRVAQPARGRGGYQENPQLVPPTEQLQNIEKDIASALGDGHTLLNNVVVQRDDYPLVDKMTGYINNLFKVHDDSTVREFTVDAFDGSILRVDSNMAIVTAAVKDLYPVSKLPHFNCGFAVYLRDSNRHSEVEEQLLFAVTAYTRFVDTGVSQSFNRNARDLRQFIPIVTVTSIVSPMASPQITAMAKVFAADKLIKSNGWLQPYAEFTDKCNIGNLIDGEDGKPFEITTRPVLEEFVFNYLYSPFLAIDVTDGAPIAPDLYNYLEPEGLNVIRDGAEQFLGLAEGSLDENPIVRQTSDEFIGPYKFGDDSRSADYLHFISEGAPREAVAPLLYLPEEAPEFRPAIITTYDEKFAPTYSNHTVILESSYIGELAAGLAGLNVQWDTIDGYVNNAYSNLMSGGNEYDVVGGLGRARLASTRRGSRRSIMRRR